MEQKEFKFVKTVENHQVICQAIKYQEMLKKHPKFKKYLQYKINKLLERVK